MVGRRDLTHGLFAQAVIHLAVIELIARRLIGESTPPGEAPETTQTEQTGSTPLGGGSEEIGTRVGVGDVRAGQRRRRKPAASDIENL